MDSAFHLKLSDSQRNDLVDYYKSKIELAMLQIADYTDLLEQLGGTPPSINTSRFLAPSNSTNAVNAPDSSVLEKSPITKVFKQSWSWSLKIKFILEITGHCLTTREIVNELVKIDNSLDNPLKSISSTISVKVGEGIMFDRYLVADETNTSPNQGTYYNGLKEWFDEEGNLKEEKYRGKE